MGAVQFGEEEALGESHQYTAEGRAVNRYSCGNVSDKLEN